MKKLSTIMMVILLTLSVVGCCQTRTCVVPTDTTSKEMKWLAPSKFPLKTHTGELLSDSIRSSVSQMAPEPMNILILSGGGQNGAFGAGFLNGLAARSDQPDLSFNIVTGISTGALQATHAFLGPQYYEELKNAYTNVSKEDIYSDRAFLELLCASSVKDTTPLRSLIESLITMEILHKVADAHEAGGRLFVGTVNLDTGEFVSWNMGEIATNRSEEALSLYVDILMAAAAFPLFFPPVPIKQETSPGVISESLHIDGGARESVFFRQFMLEFIQAVKAAIKQAGPDKMVAGLDQATMTVIVNGKIGLGYECVQERLADVGIRSLNALADQSTINAVFRTYALACANQISFKMTRIPDDANIDPNSLDFNTDTMRMLYDLGFDMATSDPLPWETTPPTGEDIDALCG